MSADAGKGRVRNRIRALRLAAGLSQQELAGRVGATRQTINAIEQEKYSPSLELAFRIARSFDVGFEDVFQFDAR
jgi:putative transcriptional regulator